MKLYFYIEEFLIAPQYGITAEVADKLMHNHIWPMNQIRVEMKTPIWASQRSGYRPVEYELQQGRSGSSQHTFKSKGAADWTCTHDRLTELANNIMHRTNYTRIAYYPGAFFFHCDYKYPERGQRFFIQTAEGWAQESSYRGWVEIIENDIRRRG